MIDNFIKNIPIPFIKVRMGKIETLNNGMLKFFDNTITKEDALKLLNDDYKVKKIISLLNKNCSEIIEYIPLFKNWFKIEIQYLDEENVLMYFSPILKYYKELLHSINDSNNAFFIKNKNLKYVACNEKFAKLANSVEDLIFKKTDIDIWGETIGTTFIKSDKDAINNKDRYRERVCLVGNILLNIKRHFIYSDKGEIIMILGICEYVSNSDENLKTPKEYVNVFELVENKIDRLSTEFFANLSHEFRTPITIISSYIQMIEEQRNKNTLTLENLDRYLKIISLNKDRLLKLINNLIDSTKLNSDYVDYCPQRKDIINFVEEICMSVVDFAKRSDIDLIFDTQIEEKTIAFDPDKLERAILNILSNSIKYNKINGKIFVNVEVEGDILNIKIKDTGIGIPDYRLKNIFDKFRQVDDRFTKVSEGSGLGLTIAKSLVELHNGSINVSSDMGIGSEFVIQIPCNNDYFPYNNSEKEIKEDLNKRIQIEFSDIYPTK
jgi:signal transduction histidine kinase